MTHVQGTRTVDIDCPNCPAKEGTRCTPKHPCEARRVAAAKRTREANARLRKERE